MRPATRIRRFLLLLLAFTPVGCDSEPLVPDESVAQLVGSWDAIRMNVARIDAPGSSLDLIALGVSYFVDVQPSGQYTSILRVSGQTTTEFGRVEIVPSGLVLHREQPSPRSDPGTYRISGDTLFLTIDSEFDLDFDGRRDAVRLSVDLTRRP